MKKVAKNKRTNMLDCNENCLGAIIVVGGKDDVGIIVSSMHWKDIETSRRNIGKW